MSPSSGLWSRAPENLELTNEQVHLWRFRLDLPPTEIVKMKHLLSDDERSRADRLIDPLKARQFMVARGRLRQILARYTDLMPYHIRFNYGEHGKPVLANNTEKRLAFNLSHAGAWGVLSVIQGEEVGVDIESIDPKMDYKQVASNFFSESEIDTLQHSIPKRRRRTFYRIWTRKEASIKRAGTGFSDQQTGDPKVTGRIKSFIVDQNTLGSVAVAEEITHVQRWAL